jgi:hypothetical protein
MTRLRLAGCAVLGERQVSCDPTVWWYVKGLSEILMLTGEIRGQVDRIWDAFWSGGISNPLEVIEQITYLLFLRRLDDLHILEENKAARLKKPLERRIFPEGKDDKGRAYDDLRWSRFKHFAPAEMYTLVSEHVFPFLRTLGGDDSTYAHPARVNQHVVIVRPTEILHTVFLEQLLLCAPMKRQLLKIAGAGATREAITKAEIEKLRLVCPPRSMQRRFAEVTARVKRARGAHYASLAELDALFASLQHRAFRGEL